MWKQKFGNILGAIPASKAPLFFCTYKFHDFAYHKDFLLKHTGSERPMSEVQPSGTFLDDATLPTSTSSLRNYANWLHDGTTLHRPL